MAKANRSKGTAALAAKGSFKGIPKTYYAAVQLVMGNQIAKGRTVTPQGAYQIILEGQKERKKEQEVMERKTQRKFALGLKQEARDAFGPAFNKLATVRDLLNKLEAGEFGGFDYPSLAMLSRAALTEGAKEIEQAAFTLGLLPKYKAGESGWFVDQLA